MIGKIKSYDADIQTGAILCDEQYYEFHINDWSEPVPPIIDADVLFESEGTTASMVTLIGSYLDHQEPVKSRRIAIALALFPITGLVGGHRWYLGYYKIAALQMIVSAVTIGFGILWPFVEALLLYLGRLAKDAKGRPLK